MSRSLLVLLSLMWLFVAVWSTPALAQRSKEQLRKKIAEKLPPTLYVADPAPNFVLKSLDGESWTDLKLFRDKKPVVLIFGSYS